MSELDDKIGARLDDVGTHLDDVGAHLDDTGAHLDDTGAHLDDTGTHLDDVGTEVDLHPEFPEPEIDRIFGRVNILDLKAKPNKWDVLWERLQRIFAVIGVIAAIITILQGLRLLMP